MFVSNVHDAHRSCGTSWEEREAELRQFRFEGERLILDADTHWGKVHIVWHKAPRAASTPQG
jgi:hypothetical protein